ncbi:MAG: 50S ribosomal protein L17 [Phototrophicales bacterium]|nr:MAG: 50S ribosomal protein L17 [Phototrophicales bacterium]
MRHRVKGRHFSRTTNQRRMLMRSLASALITHERITTTEARADFVREYVEKLITVAKRGLAHEDPNRAIHARRIVGSRLYNDRDLVKKIFDELAPRYQERAGGYTRVLKLGPRKGDAAPMVIVELVDRPAS